MKNLFDEEIYNENNAYNVILEKTKNIHIHDYQLGVLLTYRNLPKKMKDSFYCNENGFGFCDEFFNCNGSENFEKYNFIIRELNNDDIEKIDDLYKNWVNLKVNDGKTFVNMFPKARYKRCYEFSIKNYIPNLITLGCFSNDVLLGFRVLYIRDNYGYDLAYCSERTIKICSDFSEKFNINMLKYLKDNYNIKYFNCGLSDGALKKFKQHLPNKELIYYRSKI